MNSLENQGLSGNNEEVGGKAEGAASPVRGFLKRAGVRTPQEFRRADPRLHAG